MKIHIKKRFRHQVDARTTREYRPGIYEVGKDISKEAASLVFKFGKAEVVAEAPVKIVPENKVVEAPENKAKVAIKSGNRRSTRAESDE